MLFMADDLSMPTSPVVQIIATQVRKQIDLSGVQLLAVDDLTLRVSFAQCERGTSYRNVDIRYHRGHDLYDLEIHTVNRATLEHTTERIEGIYFDQFGDLLARDRHAA